MTKNLATIKTVAGSLLGATAFYAALMLTTGIWQL